MHIHLILNKNDLHLLFVITLKIENVDDTLFDMMNNETAIFDDEMKSDDVNNEVLTNFVREIIRQLGGNDRHVEDWVIELCRVEL
jgi:hypothetical protein